MKFATRILVLFSLVILLASFVFAQGEPLPPGISSGSVGGLLALGAAFLFLAFLLSVAVYVYTSWALMTIAKKLKYKYPWLAWIPIANAFMLPPMAGWNVWWALLLLVPFVNFIFLVIFFWKIFEKRKYPGALSLVILGSPIPFIGFLCALAFLVVLGLVAWSDR